MTYKKQPNFSKKSITEIIFIEKLISAIEFSLLKKKILVVNKP